MWYVLQHTEKRQLSTELLALPGSVIKIVTLPCLSVGIWYTPSRALLAIGINRARRLDSFFECCDHGRGILGAEYGRASDCHVDACGGNLGDVGSTNTAVSFYVNGEPKLVDLCFDLACL